MDTTTPVDGVANDVATGNTLGSVTPAEPTTTEAVADESQATPADETSTSPTDQPSEQAAEEAPASDKTDEEIQAWAEKKGLKIDPSNPNEVKLARMQLDNERRFHEERNAQKVTVNPPEEVPLTGNESMDEVIARQNKTDMQLYVRDWFDANPDMKDYRTELAQIANDRPWLQNMDDVKAHFLADPSRAEQLKREGGREALTNLAQKQQNVPPTANATDATVFQSAKITPQNVDELVAKNDQRWYQEHRDEILAAAFGNVRN